MGVVLAYPLTPVPLPLCDVDGIMMKTPKSAFLYYLESRVVTIPPVEVDVYVIVADFALPTKFLISFVTFSNTGVSLTLR